MKFAANSSVLIFLAKLDVLHLLEGFELFIPDAVKNELLAKESVEKDRLEKFLKQKTIKIIKIKKLRQFSAILGKGEMAVLNIAVEKKISDVLLDDRRARSLAKLHGLTPRGTIWVILNAFKNGVIDKKETKSLIYNLPSKGFRIDEVLFMEILKKID
ncbi:DUF3368 domain-containing protein [Candidatus Peregrinibacteria bacterium]|nr:DUF3368 domain-containing protein [Candidatus Peregrinibacteria bacterium]